MKLYHYSADSYKGAKHLTNDYKNNYKFAEPYILALRKSREVFNAVFFATMYMSREVKALALRKYEDYQKAVVLCQDLAQNKVRNFRDSRGSEYRYAGLRPDPRFIALALGA